MFGLCLSISWLSFPQTGSPCMVTPAGRECLSPSNFNKSFTSDFCVPAWVICPFLNQSWWLEGMGWCGQKNWLGQPLCHSCSQRRAQPYWEWGRSGPWWKIRMSFPAGGKLDTKTKWCPVGIFLWIMVTVQDPIPKSYFKMAEMWTINH